jgi:hypothetical protein
VVAEEQTQLALQAVLVVEQVRVLPCLVAQALLAKETLAVRHLERMVLPLVAVAVQGLLVLLGLQMLTVALEAQVWFPQ